MKKSILFASLAGNIIEWYDFVVYASLSPLLVKIFFPQGRENLGFFLTFGVFAASFMSRPLGGLILSRMADVKSRKKAFLCSIFFMGISSLIISILPTPETLGAFSTVLLLFLRLMQGFAIGGEYPILVTYIYEHAPTARKSYLTSFVNTTTVLGVVLGIIVTAVLTTILHEKNMLSWGWRLPFTLTSVLAFIGLYLRKNFIPALPQKGRSIILPKNLRYILNHHKLTMTKIFLYTLYGGIAYYFFNIFSITFITKELSISYASALNIQLLGCLVLASLIPVGGILSDKYDPKWVSFYALLGFIATSYLIFQLFEERTVYSALLAQLLFASLLALYLGSLPSFIAQQGTENGRCSLFSLPYNLSLAIFGGTAPAASLMLIQYFETIFAPLLYLTIAGMISLVATLFMDEFSSKDVEIVYAPS